MRLITLSTVALAAAYASAFLPGGPPPWAAWVVAVGTVTLVVALIRIGARRADGSHRVLWLPLAVTWLVLFGSLALALGLPTESAEAPALLLGLPRRAALILYGVGLLPALVLPFTYVRTFDRLTLPPEELARIRALRRAGEAP